MEENCFACYVGFWQTTTMRISHNCTYISSLLSLPTLPPSLPSRSLQSTRLDSLCYTATAHQLSILHMIVYIFNVRSSVTFGFGISFVSWDVRVARLLLPRNPQMQWFHHDTCLFVFHRCVVDRVSRGLRQLCACGCPGTQVCAHIPEAPLWSPWLKQTQQHHLVLQPNGKRYRRGKQAASSFKDVLW